MTKNSDHDNVTAHTPAPAWYLIFLAALEETGTVGAAARAAGISRNTAYRHRDDHEDFKSLWDDAIQTKVDEAEETLISIGIKDRNVQAITTYLKSKRAEYRENAGVIVNQNHITVADQATVDALKAKGLAIRENQEIHEVDGLVFNDVTILEEPNDE